MNRARTFRADVALLPGALVGLQAFLALATRDGWSLLLAPDRETWLLVALLWLKDLALGLVAGALAFALSRWLSRGLPSRTLGGDRRKLVLSAAVGLAFGTALRWVGADFLPPAQFSDTFSEIEHVLRDPGTTWLGTTPFPGSNHDQISNLYARGAHLLLTSFGGRKLGLLAIAAVPATLLLPAVLWLGAEIWSLRVGVVALWLVAGASWPLDVGRWGFTGSAMLPLLAAGAASILAGQRTHRAVWGAFGGLCLGLSLHTHPAAWAVVGLLAVHGLVEGATKRLDRRVVVAAAASGAVALAPFALGFVQDPSRIGGHLKDVHLQRPVRDVTAPSGAGSAGVAARLAYNFAHYTSVFAGGSDPNPRHALAGRPALPLALGLAALFGAAAGLRPGAARGERILLVFAGGALLSGVLADPGGVPNTFRICAFIVPAFLWAAFALEGAAVRLEPFLKAAPAAVLAFCVAAMFAVDAVPFLAVWPFQRSVEASFCTGETEAGRLLYGLGADRAVIDPRAVRHPVVVELFARGGATHAPLQTLPRRAPAELGERVGFWYVTDARGTADLSSRRRCGRPVGLSLAEPDLALVRVGR